MSLFIQGTDDPGCDWRGLMILDRPSKYFTYKIDEVPSNFSHAPNGIKVSELAIQTVFEPYKNSWGTMVTLRTARNSAAKGTSLLTSSHFL